MPAPDLDALVIEVQHVVSSAIPGGALNYGVAGGDRARLNDAIVTLIYEKRTGRPIACNVLTVFPLTLRGRDEDVLHLGLAVIDPEFRGTGLSWALYGLTVILMFMRRGLRPVWISSVTQVPAVAGLVAEGFANVYPDPRSITRRTYAHLSIARQVMRRFRASFGVAESAGFDADRFVITNAYTGGSDNLKKAYNDTPRHRNERVNDFCRAQLDYDRGDDLLQVGQCTLGVLHRFLFRSVPRGSLPAIFGNAVVLLLAAAFIPVTHWFAAGKSLGDLRPARR